MPCCSLAEPRRADAAAVTLVGRGSAADGRCMGDGGRREGREEGDGSKARGGAGAWAYAEARREFVLAVRRQSRKRGQRELARPLPMKGWKE